MINKWFHPKTHVGWKKSQSPEYRRRKLLETTDKRWPLKKRYLRAAYKIQALANVTKDKETSKKASMDAKYFFAKHTKLNK